MSVSVVLQLQSNGTPNQRFLSSFLNQAVHVKTLDLAPLRGSYGAVEFTVSVEYPPFFGVGLRYGAV